MSNTATEKQIGLIERLKAEREPTTEAVSAISVGRMLWKQRAFTKEAASAVIEVLLETPRLVVAVDPPAPVEPPEGMHRLDGTIYKVQRSPESGRVYAKVLVLEEPDCGGCANDEPCGAGCTWTARFEYAPGAVKALTPDTLMSLAEAKEFGVLYGTCCVCGRTLTNEESIAAGIGPVCAGKWSA